MTQEIVINVPDNNAPGFIKMQCELTKFRARIKDLDPARDVKFWEELARFAEQFIVTPSDPEAKKAAAMNLSRSQLNQIMAYLQGDEEAQAKPPLSTAP